MGDGGVACMPSQLVVEGFPASEKLCGSGSGELEKKMRELERRGMSCSGDKSRKTEERSKAVELENGEFVPDRREKGGWERGEESREDGELEKGEIVPDDWCDRELEKGEFVPEKSGKGVAEKSKVWLETGHKGELEKGEFVPDKWPKWHRDRSPSNQSQKVESGRSDRKRLSSKLDDCSHERREDSRFWKHGNINGGSHGKECVPGSILKRHHVASEVSGGKYQREFKDHSGAKSRKISDESSYCRSEHFDKSQRGSTYPPSRASSTTRYSSRHIEPYFSARGHDKHGRSPENSLERSSLNDRSRHHDRRNRSPLCLERSPHQLTRHRELRERTPIHLDKSPHQRSRHHDHKDRNSSYAGRSPHERNKHRDHKDKTPVHMEHSPRDRDVTSHQNGTTRRSVGADRKNKPDARNARRDTSVSRNTGRPEVATLSSSKDRTVDGKSDIAKDPHKQRAECSEPPPPPPLPPPPLPPPPVANGVQEDLPSMEEDMDICDTPPHSVATTDPNMGKWYYLDHFGAERGPSKLMDLKKLVEEGVLLSDHLIKHTDSDRWVTVENAASPLVYADLHPIVSDNVTQLVSPPEAPGNLLNDADNVSHDGPELSPHSANDLDTSQFVDLGIDERVVALLDGYDVIPGKELETLNEALGATFVHAEWENWGRSEGFSRSRVRNSELTRHLRDEESCRNELVETRSVLPSEKEFSSLSGDSSDWFAGRWSCKGGDWKRNEDLSQERLQKRKLVLNDGYPLCLMPKCGYEDPRWQAKDDLYHVSCGKKLDLPTWSFSWLEDKVDSSDPNKITSRSSQVKPFVGRGTKGIMLPVIRINACVVKDHGFSASESRSLGKSNDRHSSRSMRSYNGGNERSSLSEDIARLKGHENELHKGDKFRLSISIPSDRVCTREELGLHMGDWYYLDGTGREHGPYLFSELQEFVACGTMLEHTSVFRKADSIWVPVTSKTAAAKPVCSQEQKDIPVSSCGSLAPLQQSLVANRDGDVFSSFHGLHPQFIGFMCGKLHELVMKSYRSREFGAAINGVLDPWLNMNQPKELDKNFWKSEADLGIYNHTGKRPRLSIDSSCEDHDMDEDVLYQKDICSFDELCAAAASSEGNDTGFPSESWGLLNSRILARIFHFLRNDMKTLLFSAATCKHWKIAVKLYKDICRYVDFSTAGPNCTDPMFQKIMNGYDGKILTTLILTSCTNVSASALEEVLRLFPGICTIDIRGCNQFEELIPTFQNVKWIHSQIPSNRRSHEDAPLKTWSHKQNTEKSYSMAKSLKGSSNYQDGFNDGDNLGAKLTSTNKMDFKNDTFKQGYYRRTKLLGARKSSGALSRDAQLKQLMRKKSESAYRKMEQLIANALRNIMKDNSFEFLIPKVKGIEDKMRNGYYARHGLTSIKDDIRQMCRNIIKNRRRSSNVGELNLIISSFLQLAEQLDNPKHSYEGESLVKAFAESSDSGSYSADSKYKKKTNKIMSEKNYTSRNTNSYCANGESNYKVNDIKQRLSKLSKRYADSDSETSDDGFFDDANDEGESSGSETESDLDMRSEVWQGSRNDFFIFDEVDTVDDREWGARMTKASLVPPVTRKYEVIEKYLIVADEKEVERKMTVALPDDYAEKLVAQCNGVEEMEIPEVKDYKPRKLVGVEVLEQEVYGIDPYTHNLLLDSMQEMNLPLAKMHLFIEEVLLRALNKQVREFTGTGNAPMVYQLQPVIEELKRTAEMGGEIVTMKMCNTLLKSMRNRSVENYVAYRKGLGVVCNTEKGFSEDDFVVEFLGEVYPAWRWYEKQDGIRSLQKSSKEPLPEFYNIYLERPKGDSDGYDLVVVDAMHKANYASRICHSCRPNCEAKVTAVDGRYQIGIYTLRPIAYGEEITFDYNSVTESKDEYEASVCLCGSQICRGSYLNLTGEEAFQNILKDCHGMLDRHKLILEACETSSVSQEDYIDLAKAGLGSCLLAGLPDWLIAYSAHLVRFINFERRKLPEEILRHNMEEKKKYIPNYNPEDDKNDAEVQAEGVFNQRLQNMAVTIDKVKHVMKSIFGDPKKAPPPLQKLSPEEIVFAVWKGDGSVVEELLKSMAVYMEADLLNEIKSKIRAHDPFGSADLRLELKRSLIWLRDEIRDMPCSQKCRNDAAADLIHMYAYTENFFKIREYESFTSPPVYISPLDMGPKYMETMGSGFQEYCKTYDRNYCLGQLIFWHNQTNPDPDSALAKARRGCLSLPDVSSFYANPQKPTKKHIYGAKTLSLMLRRMEYLPQRPWPKEQIWEFKPDPKFFGSPMLDGVLNKRPLDADMMHWLKNRPPMFQGARDG